jgi:hypothetical protein
MVLSTAIGKAVAPIFSGIWSMKKPLSLGHYKGMFMLSFSVRLRSFKLSFFFVSLPFQLASHENPVGYHFPGQSWTRSLFLSGKRKKPQHPRLFTFAETQD